MPEFLTAWDRLLTTNERKHGRGRKPSLLNKAPTKLEVLLRQTGKFDYEVAAELHIPESHLSDYKIGKRVPRPEILMRMSEYFKVNPKELVGFVRTDPPEV